MIHPSYVELMDVVNHEVEKTGDQPVVNSRYSIVTATAKRARQIIDGADPLIPEDAGDKPLSIAVDELYKGNLKILTDEEIKVGEEKKKAYEAMMEKKREEERLAQKAREEEEKKKRASEEDDDFEDSEDFDDAPEDETADEE
ncbi:MAG: DNA-directed RNA polymerase subunit omega [Lachnospiraceae bacterium]|nr:DNA-directed RNA polymerase subunit omega [Lachnospiraceae bacterium]